jgi:hypothetical protein
MFRIRDLCLEILATCAKLAVILLVYGGGTAVIFGALQLVSSAIAWAFVCYCGCLAICIVLVIVAWGVVSIALRCDDRQPREIELVTMTFVVPAILSAGLFCIVQFLIGNAELIRLIAGVGCVLFVTLVVGAVASYSERRWEKAHLPSARVAETDHRLGR